MNRLLWHTSSDFYAIRTPTLMPCESFLLGVWVDFNILTECLRFESNNTRQPPRASLGKCSVLGWPFTLRGSCGAELQKLPQWFSPLAVAGNVLNIVVSRNSGITPANQTKDRSVHELFPGGQTGAKVRCESCFPRKNTRIHKSGRNS